MKTTIKILIPLLIAVGFVVLVYTQQRSIDEFASDYTVEPFDFRSAVSAISTDSICNRPLKPARNHYNALYNSIDVESQIIVYHHDGNSSVLLAPDAAQACFEDASHAYGSVFCTFANSLFNSSEWNVNDLDFVKRESLRLKSKKGCDAFAQKLDNYVQYVEGYDDALCAIQSASYCNSASTYKSIVAKKKKYSVSPYTNCSQLKGLNNAPATASKVWAGSIRTYVNNICNKHYKNYEKFEPDYNKAWNKITSYRAATNSPAWGAKLTEKLDDVKYNTNWGLDF